MLYYKYDNNVIPTNKLRNTGDKAKFYLSTYGVHPDSITIVPIQLPKYLKTYHTAVNFRNYLASHDKILASFNVYSPGVHARRSYVIYNNIFDDNKTEVGIVAGGITNYSAEKWYLSRKGIRLLIKETIGLSYYLLYLFD